MCIRDCDAQQRPDKTGATVCAVRRSIILTKAQILRSILFVFSVNSGRLDCHCHIRLDPVVTPVQHAP